MADHVRTERTEAVGRIVMDRPETHNSQDAAMAGELRDAVVDLATDDAVRAIVLTGSHGVFNTGADLGAFEGDASDADRLRAVATRLHEAVRGLATAPKPVLTGVNGVAAGGGFGLALAGDIVLVSDAARFEFAYPKIALSGDAGSTYFLPRLVGRRTAREIALLDEPIDPDEAVDLGLATEVVADEAFEDRLAELAADLAAGPTLAYGATKELLESSMGRDLGGQLAAETDTIAHLATTEDYARGHAAFFSDETPEFEGE